MPVFRRIAIAVLAAATMATAAPAAQAAPPKRPGKAPIVIQGPQPEKPGVTIFRSSWS